ncbi:DEP domain-containing protein 1A [Eublepharis macularius]|uniref:DEP domain-containing protein 1A n=1 Tax=Eublepharis macularius TaxID=481883 RepID=A0AA97JFT1_EUBMA|nr:DEP domain-containing protein 1A [Eublepharis macularius]
MESRLVTPGPFRATKLWNEITKYFRAGMPRRKHRQHFKKYGNCFTAAEATDWLHELLKSNNNFGLEVTRQQTVQLLRKFLKNHVIEDIKGRWGSENLNDNSNLYRFPSTSPVRSLPSRCPLRENKNIIPKEPGNTVKLPHFSRITPKKCERLKCQENAENLNNDTVHEDTQKTAHGRSISQADIEEIWRSIILIHLQTILAVPSLEEVLHPAQILPQHIVYNMMNTGKRGVVVLQDKSEDLPHWVLSAMKCLANWPRSNDLSQPTYKGFERDVFKTVADYFLSLPEPLLTFEYYELFVNILVLCGYITIPNKSCGKPSTRNDLELPKTPRLNSFRSTECLLLSMLHHDTDKKDESETSGTVSKKMYRVERGCGAKLQQYNVANKCGSVHELMGGSYQNLSRLKSEQTVPLKLKARCCSLEGIADTTASLYSKDGLKMLSQAGVHIMPVTQNEKQLHRSQYKPDSLMDLCSNNSNKKKLGGVKRVSASGVPDQELHSANYKPRQLCRSQSLRENNKSSQCGINAPVAEITVKPHPVNHKTQSTTKLVTKTESDPKGSDIVIIKRLCKSSTQLSENTLSPAAFMLAGPSSLLQPHLERVAIEALQICCLLLPPPNRRKLQLLMRMISRMSENVDMPRLHDTVGTRSLMIQTFSRCVLCCEEEVDLDELLATRLVSFLMDHHQDILKVPTYLQVAVQDHIESLKTNQNKCLEEDMSAVFPTYSYCKRISTQEFNEQKIYTSQAAVAELLESIIKDRNLSLKDKKKKLKQFQKEYPQIYRSRFPSTESEAMLFEDKPTIKQPMLTLQKPKFCSLRH